MQVLFRDKVVIGDRYILCWPCFSLCAFASSTPRLQSPCVGRTLPGESRVGLSPLTGDGEQRLQDLSSFLKKCFMHGSFEVELKCMSKSTGFLCSRIRTPLPQSVEV